ncbi:DUF350 domain-containing protein [Desulfobacula sp.]|uniref:DUF350 domain-containing protein n=1 Tax=Desulfobacula sp. TaxID=2593537 RepID=UPI001D5FAC27|nr:DUF350 domain-containing protein [Desulfobacula sp.]MBC2704807.1 DUF350 domain-containing protein [Desulfobacula sp.]MBW2653352.1 DUF350 domain-containing protein [Deltaproteobacteria bacterium]
MEAGIIMANFLYAIFGVILTLVFMLLGFKLFDKLTPFDTSKLLSDNNIAVGIVVGSIFIGLGIAVGLVIGMGLN